MEVPSGLLVARDFFFVLVAFSKTLNIFLSTISDSDHNLLIFVVNALASSVMPVIFGGTDASVEFNGCLVCFTRKLRYVLQHWPGFSSRDIAILASLK